MEPPAPVLMLPKQRVNICLNPDVLADFKTDCQQKGISLSLRVEALIWKALAEQNAYYRRLMHGETEHDPLSQP